MLWPARTSPRGHSLSSPRGRLTLQAAAARHRLTMQALRLAVRRGQLPVLRAGRTLWVSETDLAAFLATYHARAEGSDLGSAASATPSPVVHALVSRT
jgi:hypothetical protein